MGRFIVKLDDWYLEWSTVSDAPVTRGMSREDFDAHYRERYGSEGMRELPARMERVDEKGTSSFMYDDAKGTIEYNRAGPNETTATRAEIIERYCVNPYWLTEEPT